MNEEKFRAVCEKLVELYKVKDKHYGNSFHKQFETFGLNSVVMRLGDKYERLKTLTANNPEDCGDEPITDTLMDMANYAILSLMELLDDKIIVEYLLNNSASAEVETVPSIGTVESEDK